MGIVTIYPSPLSTHSRRGGVASYSKNLVNSLLKFCSVVVLAEKLPISKDNYYESALIHRCWTKDVRYPFQIFKILLNSQVDVVHIQYETYLFGGLFSALVFPLLVALVRLMRKPVIVTMHGVVPLSKMNKSFLKENQIPSNALIMRLGLTFLVRLIVYLSTSVIVHEKNLMDILKEEYKCSISKIKVVNHGIEEPNASISSDEAKKKIGLHSKRVILFFGYITGYKNLSLLIESAKFLKVENWILLIAGGMHPRLIGNSNYTKYISELREKAMEISEHNILFKGFIREEEISLYFSATDLVIFPYSICMSSSGPLSLAASYGKPFLVANSFREIIPYDDIRFTNDPKELAAKIDCFFTDPEFRLKILAWVHKFKMGRSWDKVAQKTFLLYTTLTNIKEFARNESFVFMS